MSVVGTGAYTHAHTAHTCAHMPTRTHMCTLLCLGPAFIGLERSTQEVRCRLMDMPSYLACVHLSWGPGPSVSPPSPVRPAAVAPERASHHCIRLLQSASSPLKFQDFHLRVLALPSPSSRPVLLSVSDPVAPASAVLGNSPSFLFELSFLSRILEENVRPCTHSGQRAP